MSLAGRRAFIVTDPVLHRLGFTEIVAEHLRRAGIELDVFAEVEPEPSLETVRRGADALRAFAPDWIIGLGGGSAMDAAKAMWVLYERPDIDPASINPLDRLGLGVKARLITIPTTSGTGSEATWATVLTDTEAGRKLGLGSASRWQPSPSSIRRSLRSCRRVSRRRRGSMSSAMRSRATPRPGTTTSATGCA